MSDSEESSELTENQKVNQKGQQEADKLLDYQISWAMQSDEEILRLLRLNIVVLGAIASFIGVFGTEGIFSTVEIDGWFMIGIILSLVFWVFSILVALVAYKFNKIVRGFEKWPSGGFESLDIEKTKEATDIGEYYSGILDDYDIMIEENQKNIDCKYTLHMSAALLMVISLTLFGTALGRSLLLPKFSRVFFGLGLMLSVIGFGIVFISSLLMKDYTAETDREGRLDFLNPYDKDRVWHSKD